jgi:hypothetical protein
MLILPFAQQGSNARIDLSLKIILRLLGVFKFVGIDIGLFQGKFYFPFHGTYLPLLLDKETSVLID